MMLYRWFQVSWLLIVSLGHPAHSKSVRILQWVNHENWVLSSALSSHNLSVPQIIDSFSSYFCLLISMVIHEHRQCSPHEKLSCMGTLTLLRARIYILLASTQNFNKGPGLWYDSLLSERINQQNINCCVMIVTRWKHIFWLGAET